MTHKQYYQLVTFDSFVGYVKCALCWDAGQEPVDVKALKLTMHEEVNGVYIPPSEYCACDGLPEEWVGLVPDIREAMVSPWKSCGKGGDKGSGDTLRKEMVIKKRHKK